MNDAIVYESHVTVEPVFDDRLELFKQVCSEHKFRVAKLLMKRNGSASLEDSQKDSFCTGHAKNPGELMFRMSQLIIDLKARGFSVWRYKIEAVVLDSRHSDDLGLL
jgi:hypothetical protein